jgi:hypothetical protein
MKVQVPATIEKQLLERMKRVLSRLNEKNHKKFIMQSHFLDNAIGFYSPPKNKIEYERGEVVGCSFAIVKKNKDKLDRLSENRSILVSKIIDSELSVYERIEEELNDALVGYDEDYYYVPIETLEKLDDCLSLGELRTVVLHGKTLVREKYSILFNALYIGYRKCESEGKGKSGK